MPGDYPSVVIYGTGGHAKIVFDILNLKKVPVAGFLSEQEVDKNQHFLSRPVFGTEEKLKLEDKPFDAAVVALGDSEKREKISSIFRTYKIPLFTAVHPQAVISRGVKFSRGCIICGGAFIGPDVTLGESVVINSGAVIEYQCKLGDFSRVSAGAVLCSSVVLKNRVFVGAGATVIDGVKIEEKSIVGAGAVVTGNIKSGQLVKGIPARSYSKPVHF
ncbi:MAG: acetyltransferase [Deltaproteobacteria bacterium]|jgi:sugar O-acyltransferase (sialic acid O-acetyltransferase NeuD family)|nr:acetyltransferase [Deltaproteobacteria bacterium]